MRVRPNSTDKIGLDLARKHGVLKISVFGSVARGESDDNSDLDLLVEFERGSTLIEMISLEEELSATLGVEVDVLTAKSLRLDIKESVLREAVVIYERSDVGQKGG